MNKKILRSIALLLVVCLSYTTWMSRPVLKAEELENQTALESLENIGFKPNLQNDKYAIYFNEANGKVAICNKATGYIWHTNPNGIDENQNDEIVSHLNSQIIVYYYEEKVVSTMDSFSSAVALNDNRLKWSYNDNSVSVNYSMGKETISIDSMPPVISQKRMEKDVLPKLGDDEKETMLSRYRLFSKKDLDKETLENIKLTFPSIEKQNIYIRGNIPNYSIEEIYSLFNKAGYTAEDLQRDCDDNSVQNNYKETPHFDVEIKYTLTDYGFKVTVDPQKIKYKDSFKPCRISILPYFGAANKSENGYMLVPDGSGAVIEFNNGKTSEEMYWNEYFGTDEALPDDTYEAPNESSVLPFFALSNSQASFLATVNKGYEMGGVSADISGKLNDFNYIYSFFNLFAAAPVSLSNDSMDTFILNSKNILSSDIEIAYYLYNDPKSYSQLAVEYRDILTVENMLPDNVKIDRTILDVNFMGIASVTKRFLGVPYNSTASLTNYEEAVEILNKLGNIKVDVNYIKAINGGNLQKKADTLKLSNKLGSEKELETLKSKVNDFYISIYGQKATKIKKNERALTLSNTYVSSYDYDFVDRKLKYSGLFVLAPSVLETYSNNLMKEIKKNKNININLYDIGYVLTSNFDKENDTDRCESRELVQKYLETISGEAKISADKGSIYSLKYLSKIRNIPTNCSGYGIEDYAVPFYQIVVSGNLNYSVASVNDSIDKRKQFLKAVETGARLQFTWLYNRPDNIANAEENYYGYNYKSSLDTAKAYAAEYKNLAQKVSNSRIINHLKIQDDLYLTEWENGVKVYVNYSKSDKTVDGMTVKALSFVY